MILSQPQLNLNSTQKLGVTRKWYLSCYWPDFNQTLKLGSWDEQQQQQKQQQQQQHLQQH